MHSFFPRCFRLVRSICYWCTESAAHTSHPNVDSRGRGVTLTVLPSRTQPVTPSPPSPLPTLFCCACAGQVFAINTLAPFILNSKLKPAMASPFLDLDGISKTRPAFIVNVSAMEGTWARHKAGAVGGGGGIRCAGCPSHHKFGCVRLSWSLCNFFICPTKITRARTKAFSFLATPHMISLVCVVALARYVAGKFYRCGTLVWVGSPSFMFNFLYGGP